MGKTLEMKINIHDLDVLDFPPTHHSSKKNTHTHKAHNYFMILGPQIDNVGKSSVKFAIINRREKNVNKDRNKRMCEEKISVEIKVKCKSS